MSDNVAGEAILFFLKLAFVCAFLGGIVLTIGVASGVSFCLWVMSHISLGIH